MKAVICKAPGPPETLAFEEIDAPAAGADEVVVAVRAIGLNFFDTLIIQGKYQVKPPFPFSPGGEIAGVVKHAAHGFSVGDRVMAYIGHGGAREEAAVAAHTLSRIPEELDFNRAAALTIAYGTSLYALKDRGALRPGESLAILGASGGVGQAAVEIGKAIGARVIACASSNEKLAFCKALGADDAVNYETGDLKEMLKSLTRGKGVDVVYDAVGGPYAEPALRSLGWGGRYLVIGFAAGDIPKFPLNLLLVKSCAAVGVYWGAHTEREPELHRANMATLLDWAAKGTIKPHVDATFPLHRTADGLNALAARRIKGKAIVVV